ncbi:MAG: hypothetical protein QOJ89_862 [bacterium]
MKDTAIDAVVAAIGACDGPVEILGDGGLAGELRGLLAARAPVAGARPEVVVETSGGVAALAAALERVADLGTVLLAGPIGLGEAAALDLYAELHVRGLTIIGLPPPVASAPAP